MRIYQRQHQHGRRHWLQKMQRRNPPRMSNGVPELAFSIKTLEKYGAG